MLLHPLSLRSMNDTITIFAKDNSEECIIPGFIGKSGRKREGEDTDTKKWFLEVNWHN